MMSKTPTPAASPTATTYQIVDGRVCVRCIRCGAWTPAWGAHERKIRLGLIFRVDNPHAGHIAPHLLHLPGDRRTQSTTRLTPATTDQRDTIYRPVLRVGPGCETCAAEFAELLRTHGTRAHFRVKNMDELTQFLPRPGGR